jgi:hypothetical protein
MNLIVYPQPLPAITHHTYLAQAGEVSRDLGLSDIESIGQFAYTEFPFLLQQGKAAQAGRIGQGTEDRVRQYIHMPEYMLFHI